VFVWGSPVPAPPVSGNQKDTRFGNGGSLMKWEET
jgi:hypothetical protein